MAVDLLFEVLGYLSAIVDVLTFIVTGVTFGGVPLPNRYNKEFERDRQSFIIRVTRGYASIAIIYFSVQTFFSLYRGYYDAFEFSSSFIGWALVVATTVSLRKLSDTKLFNISLLSLALLITIKLCHSTYYCTDLTLRGVRDDTYNFLMLSLIFELILMMFCSLIPYLHIVEEKTLFHAFNIWGMEVIDLLAQIVVIQTYCRQHPEQKWSMVLIGYFSVFSVNLLLLMVGPHIMLIMKWRKKELKVFVVAHEIVMDSVTDIPFFCLSILGRTYIGNIFIALDMMLKGVVFVRGLIWIPTQIANDIDQIPLNEEVNGSQPSDIEMRRANNRVHYISHSVGSSTSVAPEMEDESDDADRFKMKCIQIVVILIFAAFTVGIVYALSFYLKWSVEQYHESLIQHPTAEPTLFPTLEPPSYSPTAPTLEPTIYPTDSPTEEPSFYPSSSPTMPSVDPTLDPSVTPTSSPTAIPTIPSLNPTSNPSAFPNSFPSSDPTLSPTPHPSIDPTSSPTLTPSLDPTLVPTMFPTHNEVREMGWGASGLSKCEGDCDSDDDCVGDYICFQQTAYDTPPGCTGIVLTESYDFCIDLRDAADPSFSPTPGPTIPRPTYFPTPSPTAPDCGHGVLREGDYEWQCICDDGYGTYSQQNEDGSYCNYKRKKQVIAFCLAFFFGFFGGGQWYIGLYAMAGWKLGVIGIGLVCMCFGFVIGDVAIGCCGLSGCTVMIWWIVDIILFATNSYQDGNGMALDKW